MQNYEPLLREIEKKTLGERGVFRPASPEDLASLAPFHLPRQVLEFYSRFEPYPYLETNVSICSIKDILKENSGCAIPGSYTSKYGYFVFGTSGCGDGYCFDIRRGDEVEVPIVLISHEVVGERTTAEELAQYVKPIARNLYEFLEQFSRFEVDTKALY